jgi:hypothetical protein
VLKNFITSLLELNTKGASLGAAWKGGSSPGGGHGWLWRRPRNETHLRGRKLKAAFCLLTPLRTTSPPFAMRACLKRGCFTVRPFPYSILTSTSRHEARMHTLAQAHPFRLWPVTDTLHDGLTRASYNS